MKKILLAIFLMLGAAALCSAQSVKSMTDKDLSNHKFTRPAVIDFYADWCGPCRKLGPELEKLAKEYAGKVDFFRVNVDENKEWATRYGVESIPYLLWVYGSANTRSANAAKSVPLADHTVGYIPYTDLKEILEQVIQLWDDSTKRSIQQTVVIQ